MRPPDYRYSGTFLSELSATGRASIGVSCKACSRSGRYALSTLIETHGDIVLPHALSIISANCPRRSDVRVMPGCQAVLADPVTVEEEAAIRAGRAEGWAV